MVRLASDGFGVQSASTGYVPVSSACMYMRSHDSRAQLEFTLPCSEYHLTTSASLLASASTVPRQSRMTGSGCLKRTVQLDGPAERPLSSGVGVSLMSSAAVACLPHPIGDQRFGLEQSLDAADL